jgi:PIN domain nuclease of toxin-antitoxin system
MTVILDACAMIAYLRNEEGADMVETALLESDCVAHAINLYEVYKDCLYRGEDPSVADRLIDDLASIGVVSCDDMDPALWKNAAALKNRLRNIAIPDCFALAVTERLQGVLYTSDHKEFDPVHSQGTHSISFIR